MDWAFKIVRWLIGFLTSQTSLAAFLPEGGCGRSSTVLKSRMQVVAIIHISFKI